VVRQQLGAKTHWQESSDLEMMFAGTYTSEFYRAVRNLLHDQVKFPYSPEVAQRWSDLIAGEREFRQSVTADEPRVAFAPAVAFS
jgi:anaerobic magnesium-protoporphyrin IX monomethyl ester cyclase